MDSHLGTEGIWWRVERYRRVLVIWWGFWNFLRWVNQTITILQNWQLFWWEPTVFFFLIGNKFFIKWVGKIIFTIFLIDFFYWSWIKIQKLKEPRVRRHHYEHPNKIIFMIISVWQKKWKIFMLTLFFVQLGLYWHFHISLFISYPSIQSSNLTISTIKYTINFLSLISTNHFISLFVLFKWLWAITTLINL